MSDPLGDAGRRIVGNVVYVILAVIVFLAVVLAIGWMGSH